MKIAFFDAKPYDRASFESVNTDYGAEIKFFPSHLTSDNAKLATGYDAACIFVNDFVDRETADQLVQAGVRIIALRCAGYNNIDLEAVYKRIHVVRVPAYSPHAVAEHAVALMLSLNRKTHRAYFRTRDMNFTLNGLLGFDLFGKTAGVVGTGQIGRIVAQIMRGFGMQVLASDPHPNEEWANQNGVRYCSLDELYRQSNIITLHCPLTPENTHMINESSIGIMQKGVMLINTGRGKLIDTKALLRGLKSGQVGSAGLDVYEEEADYFFEDHSTRIMADDILARLLTFPNVLITSHQAYFTQEALLNIARTTMDNLTAFMEGKELTNEICYRCSPADCKRKQTGRCW